MQTIKTHISDLKPGDKILAPEKVIPEQEKSKAIKKESNQLTMF